MKKYQPPREQFFRLPNNIFDLGLTPIQFSWEDFISQKANLISATQPVHRDW